MRPGKAGDGNLNTFAAQTLIPVLMSLKVVSKQWLATATRQNYLTHVQQLVATDPNAIKWHLVMDCLNIHQSESLVRFVAQKDWKSTGQRIWHSQIDANTS